MTQPMFVFVLIIFDGGKSSCYTAELSLIIGVYQFSGIRQYPPTEVWRFVTEFTLPKDDWEADVYIGEKLLVLSKIASSG